ncbi:MAG: hypothetical protein KGJ31_03410, partial [Patescibacteria group bacterium]|nr:hypothetical protein [Patescibacteria group bacterium]
DGVKGSTNGSGTDMALNTGTLYFGNDNYATRAFTGSLDDVRIYNRALSAQEIQQLYNLGH